MGGMKGGSWATMHSQQSMVSTIETIRDTQPVAMAVAIGLLDRQALIRPLPGGASKAPAAVLYQYQ